MSTTSAADLVKQRLLSKLERCHHHLRQLAESLPQTLAELADAEQLVRQGVLEIGRELLQGWSEAANAQVDTPECEDCQEPMRHKGYVEGPLVTTLGGLRVRRARFRCVYCARECYPHDERLRFHDHAVSWPLAKVIGRLGAAAVRSGAAKLADRLWSSAFQGHAANGLRRSRHDDPGSGGRRTPATEGASARTTTGEPAGQSPFAGNSLCFRRRSDDSHGGRLARDPRGQRGGL